MRQCLMLQSSENQLNAYPQYLYLALMPTACLEDKYQNVIRRLPRQKYAMSFGVGFGVGFVVSFYEVSSLKKISMCYVLEYIFRRLNGTLSYSCHISKRNFHK